MCVRERECVCVRARACVRACLRACVRAFVRVCPILTLPHRQGKTTAKIVTFVPFFIFDPFV